MRRNSFVGTGNGTFGETNDETGNSDLSPHIEKLRDHTFDEMAMGSCATQAWFGGHGLRRITALSLFREVRKIDEKRDAQEDSSNHEIRCSHHVRFRDAVRR